VLRTVRSRTPHCHRRAAAPSPYNEQQTHPIKFCLEQTDKHCVGHWSTDGFPLDFFRLIIVAVIGAVSTGLALVVFIRNPADRTHRAFAGTVFLIIGWLVLAFLSDQTLLAPIALPLNRLTFATATLMGASLFYFVLLFPKSRARTPLAGKAFLGLGLFIVALTISTPLVVADVHFRERGTDILPGPLLWLYAVWLSAGLVVMTCLLIKKYRRARGRQKAQVKFVLLGLTLFAVVSLVNGLLLPMLTGSYLSAELNTFSTLILVGFTAYAMIAHRFMDIRFVVMRGASYSILLVGLSTVFVMVALSARTDLVRRIGLHDDFLFAVTCVVIIFLFQPLKRITEHATDRIFYRRTYDSEELLSRLGTAVLSTLEQQNLQTLLANELAREMRLSFAAVALRHGGALSISSTDPSFTESDASRLMSLCAEESILVTDELETHSDAAELLRSSDVRVLIPLVAQNDLVGAVYLGMKQSGETYSRHDIQFLETIAREAAIAAKNAQLFDERERRVAELSAINELSSSVTTNQGLKSIINRALALVVAVTEADSGSIMLLDETEGELTIAASIGLPARTLKETKTGLGQGVSGWVAKHQEALLLVDDTDPRFRGELTRYDVACAISAPVVYNGKVTGVLSVNRQKSRPRLFNRDDFDFALAFVDQLAIAMENARLFGDLERTFLGTITALAAAVDAKDPYTYGHSNSVTHHAISIAERYGLDEAEIHTIRIASILHDIGKIGIDGSILQKPDKLTTEEREVVYRHPAIGADILASLDFLQDAVPLILFHHERYGGGGYPSGISGLAIPLGARIIAVADAYDAMTSDRPYREALSTEKAIQELKNHSGTQFDPSIVRTFLAVLAEEDEAPSSTQDARLRVLPSPVSPASDKTRAQA